MKSSSGLIVILVLISALLYMPIGFHLGGFLDGSFDWLGMHEFDGIDRFIFLIGAVLYCIIFAYLADLTLGKLAFSPWINGIVSFIAIGLAMHFYSWKYGNFSSRDSVVFIQLLTMPTFLAMGIAGVFRLVMTKMTGAVISSGRTKMELPNATKAAEIAPSADRMKAATRQRR